MYKDVNVNVSYTLNLLLSEHKEYILHLTGLAFLFRLGLMFLIITWAILSVKAKLTKKSDCTNNISEQNILSKSELEFEIDFLLNSLHRIINTKVLTF